jgi:protein-S-isoprenylcysteine O-methyltransferase Ste14
MRWKWNPAFRNPKVQTPMAMFLAVLFTLVTVVGLFHPTPSTTAGRIRLATFAAFAVLCFWHAWRWRKSGRLTKDKS